MTHTIIVDEAERDRRMVNHLNEILRHCRIGRVRQKTPAVSVPGQPFKGWPLVKHWKADPMTPAPTPMFKAICGCLVGSACGNAACPHAVIATCAA